MNQSNKKQFQTCLPGLPNQNTGSIPRTPNHDKKNHTCNTQERCVSALQNRGGSLPKEEEVWHRREKNELPKLSRNAGGKHAKLATFILIERHKQRPYPRSLRIPPSVASLSHDALQANKASPLLTHGKTASLPLLSACFSHLLIYLSKTNVQLGEKQGH